MLTIQAGKQEKSENICAKRYPEEEELYPSVLDMINQHSQPQPR